MGGVCRVEFGPGGTLAVALSRGGENWLWHGRLAELHVLQRDIGTTAADLLSGFTWSDAAIVNSIIRAHVAGFGAVTA
jgi:hypothetical protein